MFLVWTLSFLILSYTLGLPMLNSTSVSHMETFPNVTESNSTEYIKTNLTNRMQKRPVTRRCFLSTCSLLNLGSRLQAGDEIAGDLTRDPMGIGKK
ncbi:uncharacterized protein zgc:193726 [Carassius carassius]|uniref:uncharacterized protein zgc:193726 n=1 Tax=Carassius carassius TaxID=217509 RepID=UPI0028690126|nr:uncharacterized protein zgc:193726 [Carassius carassius]